ncbi:MAG: DNA polymerase V [Arenicella sp.]|jgi:DNA polymerase V
MFGVVYCPDFYIQCERIFRPELSNQILLITSNDQHGNSQIITSSREAREFGLEPGLVGEQLDQLLTSVASNHSIEVCSPNYELYADLSSRLIKSLALLAPKVSAYASDEAVLGLQGLKLPELESLKRASVADGEQNTSAHGQYAIQLKDTLKQWLGISAVIGIGTTKTLAKLACKTAQNQAEYNGVVDLSSAAQRSVVLKQIAVADITGVSKKVANRLSQINIHTALELSQASKDQVRRHSSIIAERIAIELSGLACKEPKQSVAASEVFTTSKQIETHSLKHIKRLLNTQVHSATEQLNARSNSCTTVTISLAIGPLCTQQAVFRHDLSGELGKSADSVSPIRQLAVQLLESVWSDGYQYQSLSLSLGGLSAGGGDQIGLFPMTSQRPAIMANSDSPQAITVETLLSIKNSQLGGQKRARLSPSFTTRWSEIARVR